MSDTIWDIPRLYRYSVNSQFLKRTCKANADDFRPNSYKSGAKKCVGTVASGESVLQEFYTASQKAEESVTMWGLRIEEILQKAIDKGHVTKEQRNDMLRTKFWRSLYSTDLKNATRVYFEQIK